MQKHDDGICRKSRNIVANELFNTQNCVLYDPVIEA